VRDRRIFGIAVAIVVVVLAASLLSAQVPALGHAIASLPIVVVMLVVVTGVLLVRAVRRTRQP
jgi:hypothetical protein